MGVGGIFATALCLLPIDGVIAYPCPPRQTILLHSYRLIRGAVMESSLRNHLKGKVIEIIKGGAVSEVEVETSAGIITSVITTRSVERLGLKVGDEVFAAIKASEVSIEKP